MTSISKCEDTFCKKYVERSNEYVKKMGEELHRKKIPKLIEKIDKQLDTKTGLGDEKRSELKEMKKFHEKSIRYWKNKTIRKKREKKMDRQLIQICKQNHCNPSCKNTLFESGKETSKGFRRKTRKFGKHLRQDLENIYQDIHGNRENVLRDGFYEELPPKKVAYLRKRGAISGCIHDEKLDPHLG